MTTFARVAVLGAGTMGHGIAQVAAAAGSEVTLYDVDAAAPPRAVERIRQNLDKGVALGKVSAEARDATLGRLRPVPSFLEALTDADLVVEAAPESIPLKRTLLADAEGAAPPAAVLATNTSSLSIAELASALNDPTRFLGLHFFNPVHVMALVEVVWGPETGKDELARAVAFVKELGKEPVVVKDSPGFASSRLGVLLGLEAMRMVEEGVAEPEAIDKAMELGYRHPMGPLKLTDLVGLDVRLGIAEYLYEKLGSEAFRPPEILRGLVAEGKLGKKSGQGFYRWEEK
jgi:3-hydroxybutyryl-CoA dehydrogenase